MFRSLPPRRSSAALRSAALGESLRTVRVALAANLLVAAAKLAAGLLSGSAALLAEAGHSLADSVNEVFLGISLRRGNLPADPIHPLGHGRERFLWAFMAAIASFLIGGCLSIGLAIRELLAGGVPGDLRLAGVVLAVAFVADGTSLLQSLRQARHEARARGEPLPRYVLHTSDPALRAVVVEDSAGVVGVVAATAGLLASMLLGRDTPDALASLAIGLLLAATAFGLARPLADYLIGRSLPADQLQRLYAILVAAPAVEEVILLQAVYTGPDEIVVAAKVRPVPSQTVDALAHAMDDLDRALRAALPEVAEVYIDVTTYRAEIAQHGAPPLSPRRGRA
ncbi:MAG TPA: cation diffusion facilitator family transporter [Chloroflexota bacterium]|nr:cation diffusion facilitator family transporter [Chloroflexota bacterium]